MLNEKFYNLDISVLNMICNSLSALTDLFSIFCYYNRSIFDIYFAFSMPLFFNNS